MTVNERLYLAGLLDEFDKAIDSKDEQKLRAICKAIFLGLENTEALIRESFKDK